MRFIETPLKGSFLIELDPSVDSRGSFCRLFCSQELAAQGISNTEFVQVNLSENPSCGTLRGLHYQAEPYLEAKIIYCLQGSIYDVIVDLRRESSTYLQHFSVKLTSADKRALYIPKGFAHGFLTLENHCHLLYLMSEFYKPGYERGYRYDEPAFGIQWPFQPSFLSEKDQKYPGFTYA